MKGSRELNWIHVPAWWAAVVILAVAFGSPAAVAQGRRSVKDFSAIQQSEALAIGEVFSSHTIFSTMELAGFGLAVWAFGTLLTCRPPIGSDGSVSYPSELWGRQVVRLVLVFLVLSIHDLVCTLLAHGRNGVLELNPFAASLLAHAPAFIVFKLSLTIGAATVLLMARSRRLAQVTSWWAAVIYTILILRWTTYCSVLSGG